MIVIAYYDKLCAFAKAGNQHPIPSVEKQSKWAIIFLIVI